MKAQRKLEKEQKKAKKAERNQERLQEKAREQEEMERRQQEAAAAEEAAKEAAAAAKRAAQDEKRLGRTLRKQLRAAINSDRYADIVAQGSWDLDELFVGLENAALSEFLAAVDPAASEDAAHGVNVLCEHLSRVYPDANLNRVVSPERSQPEADGEPVVQEEDSRTEDANDDASARSLPWTTEELGLLAKGVARYPGGTPERWTKITQMVKGRTQDEVIAKAKSLTKGSAGGVEAKRDAVQAPAGSDNWTQPQHAAFEAALRKVPASQHDRWSAIAALVPGKDKQQCIKRFKFLRAQVLQAAGAAVPK